MMYHRFSRRVKNIHHSYGAPTVHTLAVSKVQNIDCLKVALGP